MKKSSFPCSAGCQSVRLDTVKCHWGFETFLAFNTTCVSRWSVKERWAAVGPALPVKTTSSCLMSTLVEPASLAPGLQMTSLVKTLFMSLLVTRFPTRPVEPKIWVTHWWCTQNPLTSYTPNRPHSELRCTHYKKSTQMHMYCTHSETSAPCQISGFDWSLGFSTQSLSKLNFFLSYTPLPVPRHGIWVCL